MKKALFEMTLAVVFLAGLTVCSLAQTEKQTDKRSQAETAPDEAKPAATQTAATCQPIEIRKPQRTVRDGEQAVLGISVGGESKAPLVYIWTLSAGSFINGQGTRNITVDTTGASFEKGFTANVQISGLPPECTAESTVTIYVAGPAKKLDEYGTLPETDENAKLDALITNVTDKEQAFIFVYAGRTSPRGQAYADIKRVRAYLIKTGAPRDRVVTIDGGFREQISYELWIVPIGAENPKPTPTIAAKDIVYPKTTPIKKP